MHNYEISNLYPDLMRSLDAINGGVVILDKNLKILYINNSYFQITNLPQQQFHLETAYQFTEEGLTSNIVSIEVLKKHCTVSTIQEFTTGKIALVTGTPIFNEDSQLHLIVVTVSDMTVQYNLYQNLVEERLRSNANLKPEELTGNFVVSKSPLMRKVVSLAFRAAASDSTILLTGESGVGKEVISQLIHSESSRSNYPLIKVNCASIPPGLAESELFGYVEGAFTGAKRGGNPGIFELAHNGTIFLDEIEELPLSLQSKLLRILQDHKVTRVGGAKSIDVNFRVIAATNQPLSQLVKEGKFRSDLYYRINVIGIEIPPLRSRKEDIEPIIKLKLEKLMVKYGVKKDIAEKALQYLESYYWPGNVRELENIIENLYFMCNEDIITKDVLMSLPIFANNEMFSKLENASFKEKVKQYEIELISNALQECRTMKSAAESLQIDPATLTRKCQQYGIKFNTIPSGWKDDKTIAIS